MSIESSKMWDMLVPQAERSTDYDDYAAVYDVAFKDVCQDLGFWRNVGRDRSRVLEVGCGTGRLVSSFDEADYIGVDPSAEMLARARGRHKSTTFRAGHLGDLPVATDWASLLCCTRGSFAHLISPEDQLEAMRELRRVMKDDGQLVIDVPFYAARDEMILGAVDMQELRSNCADGQTYKLYFESSWHHISRHIVIRQHVAEIGNSGEIQKITSVQLSTKVLSLLEVELLLAHVGLGIEAVYGSYDFESLQPESARLIVIAGLVRSL